MKKILFHLNKEEDGKKALNNILNLMDDMDGEIQIELVAHSSGIRPFLKESSLKNKINEALEKSLKISICQNTLDALDISKKDLLEGMEIVSSGVGEIVRKQIGGYIYIKV